jgi:hypothetical protein
MISRFLPSRAKAKGPIVDLDAIVAEPHYFRFKGKIYKVNPVELEAFLKFTNAQATLMRSLNDKDALLSWKELAQRYADVISPLCPDISVEMIMDMQQAQVAALYQLIIDVVTGDIDDGEGKKKRLKLPLHESVQASS